MLCQGAKMQTTAGRKLANPIYYYYYYYYYNYFNFFVTFLFFVNSGQDSGPLPLGTHHHLLPARDPASHGADPTLPTAPGNFCVRSC